MKEVHQKIATSAQTTSEALRKRVLRQLRYDALERAEWRTKLEEYDQRTNGTA